MILSLMRYQDILQKCFFFNFIQSDGGSGLQLNIPSSRNREIFGKSLFLDLSGTDIEEKDQTN